MPDATNSSRPATKARRQAVKGTAAATHAPGAKRRPAAATSNNTSYAERAVLIPVGAALIARDRVVSGVNDTISTYSNTSKTQAQLRKFERRGNTARKRVEREIRKARISVERELRKRRHDSTEFADRLQGRIQSLV
jgi:hypothetical protein